MKVERKKIGFEKRVALSGRTTLSAQCTAPMKIPCHCEARAHTGFAIRIPRLIGLLQARGLWDGALQEVLWSAFFVAGEVVFLHLQALLAEDAGGDLGVPEGIFKD